jgi:hypothetical protein
MAFKVLIRLSSSKPSHHHSKGIQEHIQHNKFSLNDWNHEIYLKIPQNGLEHEEGFNCKTTKLLLLVKVLGGKSHHYPKKPR